MSLISEKLNCLSQHLYLLDCKKDLLKAKMAFIGKKVKRPRENEMKAKKYSKVGFIYLKLLFIQNSILCFLSRIPLSFKQSKDHNSEVEEGILQNVLKEEVSV